MTGRICNVCFTPERDIREREWPVIKSRIPTEPVEQIDQDRGGKFLKTWPSPFRLPHPGGFGSRGIRTASACHL
jgi:hypothetical protein